MQIRSLPIWETLWKQSSVVVVGSAIADFSDEFSDIDVFVYVDENRYEAVYGWYKSAIDAGTVAILNPSALKYDEFPMVYLKNANGHYEIETYQAVESRISAYDDTYLWIYSHARILHDPRGRFAELKKRSAYPQAILQQKLRQHYLKAWNGIAAMKGPLARNQPETVKLIVSEGLLHVLKMCCLADKKPFPYTKWLLHAALPTELGNRIRPYLVRMLELMPNPLAIEAGLPLVKPGHRNEEFEKYAMYRNWLLMKREMDVRLDDYGLSGK